ncbi:hypothetical protein LDZ95_32485 [Pseudomonas aeruginosa]|uniref:hypothetical protein n=1 Tax=Pseudomonas aeruginosa group TaxID=136841 RepID=UPI0005B514BA|nr:MULTISPECIES: hypothetical protein [Pseudomonas aeruginosa group]PZU28907.1 MAG: hypothetical protein DI584_04385 [Stenotrophomonas sp.]EIU1445483.1 hypothetical protein [Pseudomonas aeruginosa]EJH4818787.1 hypothetical protein [Pseudomonas aeruginosa]EKL8566462.1 hypothetical protein [Pseudomonas aeruginosa]EKS3059510.1 hypothetical protein [Pseudomonas aeruginosa]
MSMTTMKEKLNDLALRAYVSAGMAMLSIDAMAASDPIGAGNYTQQLGDSVGNVNDNIGMVPELLLNVSQIGGIVLAIMAWNTWKKAQEGKDQATPMKALGLGLGGVFGYFLPSMLGMGGATLLPGV